MGGVCRYDHPLLMHVCRASPGTLEQIRRDQRYHEEQASSVQREVLGLMLGAGASYRVPPFGEAGTRFAFQSLAYVSVPAGVGWGYRPEIGYAYDGGSPLGGHRFLVGVGPVVTLAGDMDDSVPLYLGYVPRLVLGGGVGLRHALTLGTIFRLVGIEVYHQVRFREEGAVHDVGLLADVNLFGPLLVGLAKTGGGGRPLEVGGAQRVASLARGNGARTWSSAGV